MKLLVIGGTRFVGRALVAEALAQGMDVTMFNRGQSNPDLFPEVEKLVGDRDNDLEALKGRRWDAVVDTCGYIPRHVRDSAKLLKDAVDHYTFISTISVYAMTDPSQGVDEASEVGQMEDETVEEITGETYGPLKVLCEETITDIMGGRATHIRAGLIIGPHDPTERFTYWPVRVAEGSEMLAPGDPDRPMQYIDARDLAKWTLHATKNKLSGAFNSTGPARQRSIGEMLAICKAVTGSDVTFTWADDEFLAANEIQPWTHLPLYVPANMVGIHLANNDKAITAGLTYRPLEETVRDLLAWNAARPADREKRDPSITREREQELLKAWHER